MLTQAVRVIMLSFLLGFSFASIEPQEIPNGIMPKRQVAGTGVTPSSSPTPSSTPSSPANQQTSTPQAPSTSSPQTTQQQQTTSDQTTVESTSVPTTVVVKTTNSDGSETTTHVSTNTLSPKTTATKKNSFVTLGSTTLNAATLKHTTVLKSALVTKHTSKSLYTSFWTADGTVHSSVYTTNVVQASTTGFAKTTISPSLADGGGNGNNLSTNSKAIIGGVVGGIGGAAVVGALVFALWRVWGKKKQANEDEYSDSLQNAKSNRESSMTFGSEGYSSTYGGRVNTASNF